MNKRISYHLQKQMFCAVLISLVFAASIFGISLYLGNSLLDHTVYAHSFSKRMGDKQFSNLQEYVESESISLDNIYRLNVWCSRGDKVYLTVYQDDLLVYDSLYSDNAKSSHRLSTSDPEQEDPENEYTLILDGDEAVRAFLYYYAGDAYYFFITVLSGMLAFLAFSLCFVVLISRKIAYIKLLKHELDILSGGQLGYKVTINGKDELAELAVGIDQMRQSIMKHQETENRIRTANSELITAMSHDLRTPLTSLLAYLEIIDRRKYTDEEQMYTLIHKSVAQTLRIKNMADKLFEYFLIYATEWDSSGMEITDADMLFHQILEDYAYALESQGISVEKDFSTVRSPIKINTELLHRALDNLYSNLVKYADPSKPVNFSYHRHENRIFLKISNGILACQEKNESTGIGLNTCRQIFEHHKGLFTVSDENGIFTACIELPLYDE